QPHGELLQRSYIVLGCTLVASRPGLPAAAHPGGQARSSLRTVSVMTATPDVRVRRIYDPPEPADGHRVLVDRLWPRGVAKSAVHDWDKAVAPSTELRRWYGHEGGNFAGLRQRYPRELQQPEKAAGPAPLRDPGRLPPPSLLPGPRPVS